MPGKSKHLTHLTIALGVLVLLVAGYAFKDKAVEQWYLWKLESEDEETRKAAAKKLGDMGCLRAIPCLLLQIERSLPLWGPPCALHRDQPIRKSYQKCRDRDWEKNRAGKALAKIGTPAIPAMIASLKPDPHLTAWVKEVFVRMGAKGLPVLLQAMKSRQWHVRSQIACVLGDFEPVSEDVLEALRKALHDHNDNVRLSAMFSLGAVGPGAKESVPELVEVVLVSNGLVQQIGVQTLGMIGPDAEAAVQTLTNLLQDQDEQVRLAAADALKRIQGGTARMGK